MSLEAHVGKAFARQTADRQDHLTGDRSGLGRIFAIDVSTDHQRYELVLGDLGRYRECPLVNAVAQNGDALREFENLRKAVADVDDARAGGCQFTDERHQLAHTVDVERRRRLVEEQDFWIGEQRLNDFDELPLRRRQRAYRRLWVDVDAKSPQLLAGPGMHGRKGDRTGSGRRKRFCATDSSRTSESS